MIQLNLLLEEKGFYTFPKSISLKYYVIAQVGFKCAYYDVAVEHVSYYTTLTTTQK